MSRHKSATWAKRELGLVAYEQLYRASLPEVELLSAPLAAKLTETRAEVEEIAKEIDAKRAEIITTTSMMATDVAGVAEGARFHREEEAGHRRLLANARALSSSTSTHV